MTAQRLCGCTDAYGKSPRADCPYCQGTNRLPTPMTDKNALAQELEASAINCAFCNGAGDDGHGNTCWQCDGQGAVWPMRSNVLAALRTPAPVAGEVETGWLIELPWTAAGGGRLCWVALKPGRFPLFKTLKHNEDYDFQKIESPLKFTPESNEALRFSRKVDAEAFIEKFDLYLMHAIATEHQWINATADMLERLADPVQGEDEQFLTAYVSKDTRTIGIDHPTEADWNTVLQAHIALRDRLNVRIAEQNKCPHKPVQQAGGDQVERVAFAIIEGSSGIRAAEHAREFQTANWTDGLRSARTALAAMQPAYGGEVETNWEVWQDEMVVASSSDEADAGHYLSVYAQDGPAKLVKAVTYRTEIAALTLDTKEG